jgi:hypothetical protein
MKAYEKTGGFDALRTDSNFPKAPVQNKEK